MLKYSLKYFKWEKYNARATWQICIAKEISIEEPNILGVLMSILFKVKKVVPVYVVGVVVICMLAVLSDYKISIDSKHGFRFEPVKEYPIMAP